MGTSKLIHEIRNDAMKMLLKRRGGVRVKGGRESYYSSKNGSFCVTTNVTYNAVVKATVGQVNKVPTESERNKSEKIVRTLAGYDDCTRTK
jgi:hypothetical protein